MRHLEDQRILLTGASSGIGGRYAMVVLRAGAAAAAAPARAR